MTGGKGEDYRYLSRELAVHTALGMDTDHPLRWLADVVAEVKMVFWVCFWVNKCDLGTLARLGRVADDLELGSVPQQGRCHKA